MRFEVDGLVLIAAAVSGEPDPEELDPQLERQLAERIPVARFELLEGVAHLPSLEISERLAALIQASTSGR